MQTAWKNELRRVALPMNKIWDVNGTQHNFVIDTGFGDLSDDKFLFLDDDFVHHVPDTSDMWDLLVLIKMFSSKGQSRKALSASGKVPDNGQIPFGWSEFHFIGKRLHSLYIWNPQKFVDNEPLPS